MYLQSILGAIRSTGLTASRAIAEYCAQTLFGDQYENMPKKQDIVMPKPKLNPDGLTIKVGQFDFKPMHKLSQLYWSKNEIKSNL